MDIKNLKEAIAKLPDNTRFVVSSDEELNTLFDRWEICNLSDDKKEPMLCIYGLSGSELEEEY